MEKKEEELKSNQQKRAEEINNISDQLNKIHTPITATVYSHGMQWTIRNIEFWKQLKEKDEDFLKLINIQSKT